jgi:hypothetical protein
MARIYAVGEGYQVRIGDYGVATTTAPAIVPAAVAEELAGRPDLRIEDGGGRAHVAAVTDNGDKAAIELETEE